MKNKKKNLSEQYCHDLLNLDVKYSKALTNLVMALSSDVRARSLVQLSLSPLFHHQYSSIFKSIAHLATSEKEAQAAKQSVLAHCLSYAPKGKKRIFLQTDLTGLEKPHSPTLVDRQFIKSNNNVIKGNKPVNIGYPLLSINLSVESGWSLPLFRAIVPSSDTQSCFAAKCVEELLPKLAKNLDTDLVINLADSAYTHAAYLSKAYQADNLVSVSRFRNGMKVYTCAKGDNPKGAKQVYGEEFFLRKQTRIHKGKAPKTGKSYEKEQVTIYDLAANEKIQIQTTSKKGRALTLELCRWKDLKIRTKNGHKMKDKPLDVVSVRTKDRKTGELLFNKDLFLCVSGKRKDEIGLEEAYESYTKRYDIEPAFRFNKQRLFLNRYQCEAKAHLDNFLLVNQLANWLLYVVANEVDFIPHKWETPCPETPPTSTDQSNRLSMVRAYRSSESLFLTFDSAPFLPKTSNKGKGHLKQSTTHYKVVKKKEKKKQKE